MANTIVQTTLYGGGSDAKIIRLFNLSSDGSNETNTVIFQNSSFINNAAKGSLLRLKVSGSSCLCTLLWDQTTKFTVWQFNPSFNHTFDFNDNGLQGIHNPNGSGATGNLLLTTAGLASGNLISLEYTIKQV